MMKLRHDMLTHGVNIVAATYQGRRGGLAVAWATQITTSRILIAVGKQSTSREMILESKAFGLSVLVREQLDIARRFGSQKSSNVDKFEGIPFHTAETGSPLLDECAMAFDCKLETVYDREDGSKLIVGQIVAAERVKENFKPLIYRQEDYK